MTGTCQVQQEQNKSDDDDGDDTTVFCLTNTVDVKHDHVITIIA